MNKSVLTKELITTMPDGSKWAVPVSIIAENRATHYANRFSGNIAISLKEDTGPLFESDHYQIVDWARNNMNWDEVREFAMRVNDSECDFEDGWVNGDYEIGE